MGFSRTLWLALVVLPAWGWCEEASLANPEQAAELIEALDDEDYAKREEATRGLMALGKPAAGAIRAALEKDSSPEARERLRSVLALFEGRPSQGLSLAFAASSGSAKPSEKVVLTTTITNTSDKELNLLTGWGNSAAGYFEDGSLVVDARDSKGEACRPAAGLIGTGHGPVFTTIKPGQSRSFSIDAVVRVQPGVHVCVRAAEKGEGAELLVPRAGPCRLRVAYKVTSEDNERETGLGMLRQSAPAWNQMAQRWSGELHSNDLLLDIEAPQEEE